MAKLTPEQRKALHVVARKVRIAYPNVFEPQHNDLSNKDEYSVQIRLYEDNAEQMEIVKHIKGVMAKAAEFYWGQDAKKFAREAADSKNTRGLRYDEEGGFYFITAKRNASQQAPRVVGRDRTMELRPEDGKIYSGAICNVIFDVWCYSGTAKNGAKIPPGYSFSLCGLQFVADGDPIGGTSVAKDEDFDDLSDDDDNVVGLDDLP